jgi:hypothetical protein
MGNGKDVDNFSSGGMGVKVDIDTGILIEGAMDKKGRSYIIHPMSGKQIVGYKVPDWELYLDYAKKLASRHKDMRYVGWDIVQKENGEMCCIEGNQNAGFDVFERPIQYGLIPLYEAIVHADREFDYGLYGGSGNYVD